MPKAKKSAVRESNVGRAHCYGSELAAELQSRPDHELDGPGRNDVAAGDPRPPLHAPTIRRAAMEIPEWFDTEPIGLSIAARWKNRIALRKRFEESIEALSEQMRPAARIPDEWTHEWLARWAEASFVGILPCHPNLSPDQIGKSVDDVAAVVDMHLKTKWLLDAPTARCEAIEYPHRVHEFAIPEIPVWRGPCFGAPAPLSWQGPRLHVVAILRRIAELVPPTADSMKRLRSMAWYRKAGEDVAREARERHDDWAKRELRRAIPSISLYLGIPPAAIADKSLDLDVVIERAQEWVVRARESTIARPNHLAATHNDDFTSMNWFGTTYAFSARQSRIIACLWSAWEKGLTVSTQELIDALKTKEDPCPPEVRDCFKLKGRMHPAWGSLVAWPKGPGKYQLVEPKES